MKNTPSISNVIRNGIWNPIRFARSLTLLAFAAMFALAQAQAQNLLQDPLFSSGTTGWTIFGNGYVNSTNATYHNAGVCTVDNPAENMQAYPPGNSNSAQLYGQFANSGVMYSFFRQSFAALAGSTYSAGGWTFSSHEDLAAANTWFYYEVTFLDASNNIIGAFESPEITNQSCATGSWFPLDTWTFLSVTNITQILTNNTGNTNTRAVIGNIGSGNITAPVGSATVRYTITFENTNFAGGSMFFDDVNFNLISGPLPPSLTTLSPNLETLCTNTALTATAASASTDITNVTVTTRTSVLGGTVITTNTYVNNTGPLTVTGLGSASANISLALSANKVYNTVTVKVTDGNGLVVSGSTTFDTITPALVIEAADFNFTTNGVSGVFIDTPSNGGLGVYSNQVGSAGIDENKNPANTSSKIYRPSDPVVIQNAAPQSGGTGIEQKFAVALANGSTDPNQTTETEVGYNGVGDWLDYTRTYGPGGSAPAGTYNIWLYSATVGSGINTTISQVTSDPTMGSQTTTNIGTTGTGSYTDNGWNTFKYTPMVDQFGNLVSVTFTNGTQTLRSTVVGNPNIGFYMLMPITPVLTPVLQNAYPDSLHPFEPTNKFAATVGPANGAAISQSGIDLVLNGVDVTSGATITANGASWNITYPLALNTPYTGSLNVTNNASLSSTFVLNFDTFNITNYQWEAVDYDFSTNNGTIWLGGLYIDNPVPTCDVNASQVGTLAADSYFGFPTGLTPGLDPNGMGAIAQQGIDISFGGFGQPANPYRQDGTGSQPASDYVRPKFLAAQTSLSDPNIGPYNVGYYGAGAWLNYTRDWPTNYYYIWGRLAGGAGPFSGTALSVVTSGVGTSTQTSNTWGTFSDPNAAGWQAWHWIQMMSNGAPAVVYLDGKATLKVLSGNNVNTEFFMLAPAPAHVILTAAMVGGQLQIGIPTITGHSYQLLYSPGVSPASWSTVGSPVTGNGSLQTVIPPATGGEQGYYKVEVE